MSTEVTNYLNLLLNINSSRDYLHSIGMYVSATWLG